MKLSRLDASNRVKLLSEALASYNRKGLIYLSTQGIMLERTGNVKKI
jgi:hypothetical protein